MERKASDIVKSEISIGDVVNYYGYEPNRAGFIRCPFHGSDSTPSLKLYGGNGGWFCFGCHKGGSIIDFVMEHDGLTAGNAIGKLSKAFGIALPDGTPQSKTDRAYDIYRKVMQRKRQEREQAEKIQAVAKLHDLREKMDGFTQGPDGITEEQAEIIAEYVALSAKLDGGGLNG